MKRYRLPTALALTLLACTAWAQEPRLGSIDFPTSGSPEAQPHFVRGVLLLHSFEYGSAAEAFRAAQDIDRSLTMAYWGEAMTYNHPLWDDRDVVSAQAVLRRLAPTPAARRAMAPTERERMYLDAVEALWADGPKAERDTAYMRAMEDLVNAYPDDLEARAFYALSILGQSNTTRVVDSYMQAAAVAQEVFRANPNHPGGVHYTIHSFDDPTHAPLGLQAARAYSQIAPDAAHAQHMTTHIFLALGMWDDVVSQNEIAADLTWWGPGHYTAWLTYALLQQGRFAEAERRLHVAHARLELRDNPSSRSYLATMRAYHVVNTERWSDASLDWDLDLIEARPRAQVLDAFTRGYAAFARGESTLARTATREVTALARKFSDDPRIEILALELEALDALHAGDTERALAHVDRATAIEDSLPVEFGPPDVIKPSHELYGEILLEIGRPADAQREFERALAMAPGRARTLLGLARAAGRSGEVKAAARATSALSQVWHSADASLPELAELVRRQH